VFNGAAIGGCGPHRRDSFVCADCAVVFGVDLELLNDLYELKLHIRRRNLAPFVNPSHAVRRQKYLVDRVFLRQGVCVCQ